jgi:hypothetical protein
MLWLAEKAAELGVASWRAVLWHRSRSVSPRGEGEAFAAKVRARMAQALAQSEGAWLPVLLPDAAPARAAADAEGLRLALDAAGLPVGALAGGPGDPPAAVTVAVGPEGGLEPDELAALDARASGARGCRATFSASRRRGWWASRSRGRCSSAADPRAPRRASAPDTRPMSDTCLFCRIVRREIPAAVVAETETRSPSAT